MREKTIEGKLVKAVKIMGGLAPKFVSPGLDGVPDRLVLLPGGKIAFIELKAPGKELRPLQVRRKRQLESLGFLVYCIDRPEQIGAIPYNMEFHLAYQKGQLDKFMKGRGNLYSGGDKKYFFVHFFRFLFCLFFKTLAQQINQNKN